jgi:multidrug efflux pump subunit AcrB
MILGATSDTMPLTEVDDNVDTKLAQRLSQIVGVAQVIIGGEQKPAIRIQVDPAKLVTKGLSLDDVRTALSSTTVNSPKGNIDGTSKSFTIYANDQLTAANDWNNAIIAYRNGAAVRVRDIGQAVAGPEDARQSAWQNGKHGVFLVIFKQPGANVISIVDKIKAELPQIRATIPPAINIALLSDRTQTIRASILDVEITLGITTVLVIFVIFIFLRSLRTTVIPAITIPLALLGACALMWPFAIASITSR